MHSIPPGSNTFFQNTDDMEFIFLVFFLILFFNINFYYLVLG
jgi:hypothetical protein